MSIEKVRAYFEGFGIAGRIRERFPQSVRVRVKVSKMAPPLGGKIEKVSGTLEKQREEKGC